MFPGDFIITPDEFVQWRKRYALTQEQAAQKFKVTRTTIQNWEGGLTPLPSGVYDLCRIWGRRYRQTNPSFGPLTLNYSFSPMFINPYGPRSVEAPALYQETFPTNAAAIARVMYLSIKKGVDSAFIVEESREDLWNTVEICAVIRGEDVGAPTMSNILNALADQIRAATPYAARGPNSLTASEASERKLRIDVEVERIVALATGAKVNELRYEEVDQILGEVRKLGVRPSDQLVSAVAHAAVGWHRFAV